MSVQSVARARDRLLRADRDQLPIGGVCEAIGGAIGQVADFDRWAVFTTDPQTLLPSGGVVQGFQIEDCALAWDNELLDPDVDKYADLARRADPVATLHGSLDGELDRSPRFRKLYSRIGVADELRVAFVAGGSCLGVGAFIRPELLGPFTSAELVEVRQLVPVVARVLRCALARAGADGTDDPALVIVGHDGVPTAVSKGASAVMERLRLPLDGGALPSIVEAAVTKARASRDTQVVRTRVRDREGRWFCVHVTPLEGGTGSVAVLVEKARAGDLLPLFLDAFDLSAREREVALGLAQGRTASELAAELFLSVHTVRDYTKAVYAKAGVSSRGELVARLFTEQLCVHGDVVHLDEVPGGGEAAVLLT